ncbi:SPOR domain-containing protein [Helicobacter cetorum]|uniref:SPOR domain-containing protein n=1 Tax=Helicobacter cetorum TaxID=138563 RepID=UPI000CF07685|nr:SPOR domain-containing protein [Helicobacter cetorum]
MAEKEKLDDILEEEVSGSGVKKALLIVAIAIIVLAVLLMVFWKSTREAPKENFLQADSSMQKIGNTHGEKKDNEFENLNLDFANEQQEDKLDKVADNIKKQESQSPNVFPTEVAPSKIEPPKAKAMDKKLEKSSKETANNGSLDFKEHVHSKPKTNKEAKKHENKHENKEKKQAQKSHAKENAKKEVKKEAHSKHVKQEKTAKKENKKEPKKEVKKEPKQTAPKATSIAKGHYLQVGVFANMPNKIFLQEFEKLPHAIEKLGTNKRYLIGPYKSREEALEHVNEVTEKLTKPVVVEVR